MYIPKHDAIELAKAGRNIIAKLQEWDVYTDSEMAEINIVIIDLEYSLEKLNTAIQNDPTK